MEATTDVHTQVKNQGSRRAVRRARVTPDGCKLGMASRYHVSLALEEEIEHNQEKRVYAPPQLPEKLHRRAALEQDAAFRYGPAGRRASRMCRPPSSRCGDPKSSSCWWPTPTPATWATHPGCHVLKKIAQKALGLSSSGGPGLLHFPQHDQRHRVQAASCTGSRMNTLERIPEVGQRVLPEAKTAFLGNMQLFKELQGLLTPQCQGLGPYNACGHQTSAHELSARRKTPLPPRRPGGSPSPASSPTGLWCDGSSRSAF